MEMDVSMKWKRVTDGILVLRRELRQGMASASGPVVLVTSRACRGAKSGHPGEHASAGT